MAASLKMISMVATAVATAQMCRVQWRCLLPCDTFWLGTP